MYRHLSAACSFGKWPRALTARRNLALIDSMAFVEQMILRISTSKPRNGTNSAVRHEVAHVKWIC